MNLLKQHQDFIKRNQRALDDAPKASTSHTTYVPASDRGIKRKRPTESKKAGGNDPDIIAATSNAANFGVMARIVDYMKKRHLQSNTWGLALNEILDEMQVYDLAKKTIGWLNEALPNNPRLQAQEENSVMKFTYRPPHKIKNRATLVAILKKYHSDAKGALLLTELNDCIPNAAKFVEGLGSQVIDIPTQVNKRKDHAYYYNDPESNYDIDEDFVKLWRTIGVDHLDEKKIEEYLQKHGIATVKDLAPQKVNGVPKRKAAKRRAIQKVQNTHMEGVLEEYEQS